MRITKAFYLGTAEVTQAQYQRIMGVNPSAFSASGKEKDKVVGVDTKRLPVEQVSWSEAAEFCRRLSETPEEKVAGRSYHLPSEAQWECACRAGSSGRYGFSSGFEGGLQESEERELMNHDWFNRGAGGRPHVAGEKPANAWGLHDMHGNVEEYCRDCFDPAYYAKSPMNDPINPPQEDLDRVVRGGNWGGPAWFCRAAIRFPLTDNHRYSHVGFRVALILADKPGGQAKPPVPTAGPAVASDSSSAAIAIVPFDAKKAQEHQEAWAKRLGVPVESTNSLGMKLALIPPGEFDMGSTKELIGEELREADPWYTERVRGEGPQHRVRITKAFYLGTAEATQEEYQRVMGVNPVYSSASVKGKKQDVGQDTKRLPVTNVSWNEAADFCRKLSEMPEEKAAGRSYRLPSEAQWEYGCRAGSMGRFSFSWGRKGLTKESEEREFTNYDWFAANAHGRSHAAGEKPANAWGLYNMQGNVVEFCQDYHNLGYYAKSPTDDPINLQKTDTGRVGRGGSSGSPARLCRPAFRFNFPPDERFSYVGFRVAMVPAAKPGS